MRLERGDYFQLVLFAHRVQLAQLNLGEQQRRYAELAAKLGLKADVAYSYDDANFMVTEIDDGEPDRNG